MKTKTWKPVINVAIPTDIPAGRHQAIGDEIARLNVSLRECRYERKAWAVERAAIALSNSGVSACGVPTAMPSWSRR